MVGEISMATRIEVLGAIRSRYGQASKKDKSRMLDEFVAMTGCHRKHAVRLLRQGEDPSPRAVPRGRRIYDKCGERGVILQYGAAQSSSLAHPETDEAPLSPISKMTRLRVKYNIQVDRGKEENLSLHYFDMSLDEFTGAWPAHATVRALLEWVRRP